MNMYVFIIIYHLLKEISYKIFVNIVFTITLKANKIQNNFFIYFQIEKMAYTSMPPSININKLSYYFKRLPLYSRKSTLISGDDPGGTKPVAGNCPPFRI